VVYLLLGSPDLVFLPHRDGALEVAEVGGPSDHRPTWVDVDLDPMPAPTAETETGPAVAESVVDAAEQSAAQEQA
jgi:hypothetical protein